MLSCLSGEKKKGILIKLNDRFSIQFELNSRHFVKLVSSNVFYEFSSVFPRLSNSSFSKNEDAFHWSILTF